MPSNPKDQVTGNASQATSAADIPDTTQDMTIQDVSPRPIPAIANYNDTSDLTLPQLKTFLDTTMDALDAKADRRRAAAEPLTYHGRLKAVAADFKAILRADEDIQQASGSLCRIWLGNMQQLRGDLKVKELAIKHIDETYDVQFEEGEGLMDTVKKVEAWIRGDMKMKQQEAKEEGENEPEDKEK
jgi:hypothetical protein